HREGDVVDGMHHAGLPPKEPALHREVLHHAIDGEEGGGHRRYPLPRLRGRVGVGARASTCATRKVLASVCPHPDPPPLRRGGGRIFSLTAPPPRAARASRRWRGRRRDR